MEFVFFHCNDYDKQDPRILDIIEQDKDIAISKERYTGICADGKQRRLNPYNIEEVDGNFVIKNPDNTFIARKWRMLRENKNMRRNTPQTEEILRLMNLFPIRDIKKLPLSEVVIWHSDNRKFPGACQYMAFMIDTEKSKLSGVAKAKIVNPLKNLDDFPKDNLDIPLDREYIYISEVDIHPDYMGKRLCKPFLKWFMNELAKLPEKYTNFYIENASETGEGIPACHCYVKAGKEGGFNVFYFKRQNNKVRIMTTNECVYSDESHIKMPTAYFYTKPAMVGSGKKKRRKTKNTRRKAKKKRRKTKNTRKL